MLRRTPRAVFVPGATVFPGGAVDELDALALDRVTNLDDAAANAELGLTEGGLLRRIAAVRECFEESGILLARHTRVRARPPRPTPSGATRINAGQRTFAQMLETRGSRRRRDRPARVRTLAHADGRATPLRHVVLRRARARRPGRRARRRRAGRVRVGPTRRRARRATSAVRSSSSFRRCAACRRSAASLPSPRCSTRSLGCRVTGSGRPQVIAEASGERVVLPGDDASRASHWTIPLPDITVSDEQRLLASGGIR